MCWLIVYLFIFSFHFLNQHYYLFLFHNSIFAVLLYTCFSELPFFVNMKSIERKKLPIFITLTACKIIILQQFYFTSKRMIVLIFFYTDKTLIITYTVFAFISCGTHVGFIISAGLVLV